INRSQAAWIDLDDAAGGDEGDAVDERPRSTTPRWRRTSPAPPDTSLGVRLLGCVPQPQVIGTGPVQAHIQIDRLTPSCLSSSRASTGTLILGRTATNE